MAPKRNAREAAPSSIAHTEASTTAAGSATPTKKPSKASNNQSPQEIALGIWQNYLDTTPQRTKLIDVFMAFLVVVDVLQFVYCIIAGNYVCALSTISLGICADVRFSHLMLSCQGSRQLLGNLY